MTVNKSNWEEHFHFVEQAEVKIGPSGKSRCLDGGRGGGAGWGSNLHVKAGNVLVSVGQRAGDGNLVRGFWVGSNLLLGEEGTFGPAPCELELVVVNEEQVAVEIVLAHRVGAETGGAVLCHGLTFEANGSWVVFVHRVLDAGHLPCKLESVLVAVAEGVVGVGLKVGDEADGLPGESLVDDHLTRFHLQLL